MATEHVPICHKLKEVRGFAAWELLFELLGMQSRLESKLLKVSNKAASLQVSFNMS